MFLKKKQFPHFYRYPGRKVTKKISKSNIKLLNEYYDSYSYDKALIDYYADQMIKKNFIVPKGNFEKLNVEIGFGDGEYLIKSAISKPNELFIGIEIYINGVAKVLKKIMDQNINNIKLINMNSLFFINVLSSHSLDKVFIINPDPWNKKKHNKRRLISYENVKILMNIMRSKNSIFITTDSQRYLKDIREIFRKNITELGKVSICKLSQKDSLYGVSRYQRKAIDKGKAIYQITF